MRRLALLLALLPLAACGKGGPAALAPHQIHVAGSSAAYPFSTAAAERLMRERPEVIAPLVRAGGTGEGIARFCDGLGLRHPDIVIATRAPSAAEIARCRQNGVAHVTQVEIGRTAFVLVTARSADAFAAGLTRSQLYRALSGTAKSWAAIDPTLPVTPILVHGPAPSSGIADGLYDRLLAPGCLDAHAPGCDRIRIRGDGAYVGHGADAELVAQAVTAHSGAIGLLPYAQAVAHRDTLALLPLDGVMPDAGTIATGRYPAAAPLVLLAKANEAAEVPGLPILLSYYAQALLPGGNFAAHGLIPAANPAAAAQRLETIGHADARL